MRGLLTSRRTLRRTVLVTAYLAGYAALAAVGREHFITTLPHMPWSAGAALAFGLVARMGLSWAWLALVAPLPVHVLAGGTADDLLLRVVEAALPVAAAMSLRGTGGMPPDLTRLRPLLAFFGLCAATAAGMGIAHSLVALAGAAAAPVPALVLAVRVALATLVALVLATPVLVMGGWRLRQAWRRGVPSAETLLQAGALAAIGWEVFGRFANAETHFFYLMFLPLAWVTTRHGQRGAALALAATYLAPLASDWLFGHHDHAVIELQIRLLALAVISLLLGAMVSERQVAQAHMLARQTELAHVQRLNVGWEMASALAHELNQPLTAAMNYTQAALRLLRQDRPDLERVAEVLGRSVDRIERTGQIIHGLRDFMRKGDVRVARMDMADAVEDALRLVSAEANVAGVVLHAGGLSGLPAALGDKTQVVQVLVNLTRNAIQAIATAGMGGTVAISGHVTDEGLEITVADDGPGLDPAVAPRLFEPFVTTKEVGMGLGLSISKSILESQGGRLWAEAEPAAGTVFRFTLPLDHKEPADA